MVPYTLALYGMFLRSYCAWSLDHDKKFLFTFTCNEILEVQIAGGDGGGMGHSHLVTGLAIKTHPKKHKKNTKSKKTQKNTKKPKKPQKNTLG